MGAQHFQRPRAGPAGGAQQGAQGGLAGLDGRRHGAEKHRGADRRLHLVGGGGRHTEGSNRGKEQEQTSHDVNLQGSIINDHGVERVTLELLPTVQECQLDQKGDSDDLAAELLDQA